MINENCRKRIALLQDILAQANKGFPRDHDSEMEMKKG